MRTFFIYSILLCAIPAAGRAAAAPDQESSTAQGRKYFYEKKYDKALESFLSSYHKEGNRRSLMKYIEECLRKMNEPWLLGAGTPNLETLIPKIESRAEAMKAFSEIQGNPVKRDGQIIVRFPKSDYESLDDKAQKIIKKTLDTFPAPALRLTCMGPFFDGLEINLLLIKSARLAQDLIKDNAVSQNNTSIVYKKAHTYACEMTLASARRLDPYEPKDNLEAVLLSKQTGNGNAEAFQITAIFPDPGQAENWFVNILDSTGRSVARIPGEGDGFVRSVVWTPGKSLSGTFKPVAHLSHSGGSFEVEGFPISVRQGNVSQAPPAPPAVQVAEPPAPVRIPKPEPVEENQNESLHRQKILFENGTTSLKGQSWKYVRIWGRDIAPANPSSKIVILGSCTGEEAAKFPRLAEQRARQLQNILESQFGISSSRFHVRKAGSKEAGSDEPAAYIFLEESYEVIP